MVKSGIKLLSTVVVVGSSAFVACSTEYSTAPIPDRLEPASLVAAGNTWAIRRSGLAPARIEANAAAINGVIYLAGGDTGEELNRTLQNLDAYNVAANTWAVRQILPGPRSDMNGASVINGRMYVTGGVRPTSGGGTISKTLFVYNPATNQWAKKADVPVPCIEGAQGAISGKLYVYCGSFTNYDVFYRYDPATNTWAKLGNPPVQHVGGVGEVINGKFYLTSGEGGPGLYAHGRLSVYNPVAKSWVVKASMSNSRRNAAAGVINGKMYVAGGMSDVDGPLASLEVYDPLTNKWTAKAPMTSARSHAAGAVSGGKFFVIAGFTETDRTTKVEAYTP